MDHVKSRQKEGYDYYDYVDLNFNAFGGAEVNYVVGTSANAALAGSWPIQSTLPAPIPFDAQHTVVRATQDCLIRLVNSAMLTQQALGTIPPGLPVQIRVLANTDVELPNKWVILYVVGAGANAGTLRIRASG